MATPGELTSIASPFTPSTTVRRHARTQADSRPVADATVRGLIDIAIVLGSLAAVLALYLAIRGDEDLPHASVVGLWIMTGLFGLATAAAVLLLNRRRPFSPWVLLGLLPMAVSGYWILT